MSLTDLASIGSFVSGVAVLVSLPFLYFQLRQVNQQVRQAERNQRATVAQVRADRTVEVVLRATDAAMAAVLGKAIGGAELTPTELMQFLYYFRAFIQNAEDTFLQHRLGLMEDTTFQAHLASVSAILANPAYRLAWRMQRQAVGGEYAAFVDALIAGTTMRAPLPVDARMAEWRSGWAELVGASRPAIEDAAP